MSEEMVNSASPAPTPEGYYSSELKGEFLAEYERALDVEGLTNEIALLRTFIKLVLLRTSPNINLFLRTFTCLERLCKTSKRVFKLEQEDMDKIRENTIALFEGINVPTDFIKKKLH
jgi:hypothetical protein